ncbi:right-handed parallel beta-helix repeat-containing protein [Planctomyces sp. SH-PL62]|uniref:right-handed parallel beta-helix repeat-containing protein n=1 Tax=Planctomyces sp. SH-PL62 TaxID=1636152 RepID=UPI00078BF876|nr:right-handed parallel beta-helix repeat-containing protein [Planctomyces sp. SH-PL62]AMV39356.1 hypothetical protein VT85_18105 [Planctomyces sp. SH-PL62]
MTRAAKLTGALGRFCGAASWGRRATGRRARPTVPVMERVEDRVCLSGAGLIPGMGVAYPSGGSMVYYVDNDMNVSTDITRSFGSASDVPVVGDFTGTTLTTIGSYRPSTGVWSLDLRNDGSAVNIRFGGPQWKPVTGDVDGNGTTDLGLFDPNNGVWLFCTDLSGRTTKSFVYGGSPGDIALMEDFNHDGIDDPVIFNNGQWLVDTNSDRLPDQIFHFGGFAKGAIPLAFDLYGNHDPGLAVVAPQSNGQLMWYINPNRDGRSIGQYQYGANGSRPFTGNFATAGSLFVNPATGKDVAGAGTFGAPFRTINAAVAASSPGSTIRLMSGAYVENVQVVGKSDLKFVGTGLVSSVSYPTRGDGFFVYNSNNISFDDMWFASAGPEGRGVVVLASSVNTGLIRTNLTKWIGLLAGSENGRPATVNARYSQFNGVQTGSGVYLDNGANGTFYGVSASENGLASDYRADGGGLIVGGTSTAKIDRSSFVHNRHSGVILNTTARVEMSNSYSARSILGFGAILFNSSTGIFIGNTFAENGVTFGAATGMNGIEFAYNFTGHGYVQGNQFLNNTASGIYIGSAPNQIQIIGNYFSGNWSGVTMFGDQPRQSYAKIVRNYFATPADSPEVTFGVAGIGSRIHAVIGGPNGDGNLFDGFRDYLSINRNHGGGDPYLELGYPDFSISGNTYRRKGVIIPPSRAITPIN